MVAGIEIIKYPSSDSILIREKALNAKVSVEGSNNKSNNFIHFNFKKLQ